jgi:hypothetical protein
LQLRRHRTKQIRPKDTRPRPVYRDNAAENCLSLQAFRFNPVQESKIPASESPGGRTKSPSMLAAASVRHLGLGYYLIVVRNLNTSIVRFKIWKQDGNHPNKK